MLEERLLQLGRRAQLRQDSSSDSSSSDEEGDADNQLDQTRGREVADGPGTEKITIQSEFCPPSDEAAEWERLAQGHLKARCQLHCEGCEWGLASHTHQLRTDVDETGYFLGPEPPRDAQLLAGSIMAGMRALRCAGVPTFYIWMFDAPWEVMMRMWRHAEQILQGPVVLEPTFAAYHLDYSAAASRGNRYNGTNFALPHRDYTFSDSYDTAGRPKVLTIWIPVSEVCLPLTLPHFRVSLSKETKCKEKET